MRRFLAHEPLDGTITAHLGECATCHGKLEALKAEQQQFEAEIPFERFAAGVEKAARVQRRERTPGSSNVRVALALAACLVVLFGLQRALQPPYETRTKGGDESSVEFVVAGQTGQRNASPLETLSAGERVRIGVSGARYAVAVSIDDRGEVTTVYSEALTGTGRVWLPDSIEFTGSGREHLVVVLSDEPIAAELIGTQLKERFKASGDVGQLGTLDVTGIQVHRTFIKP
ncbi:MAG: ACP synthase [Myxococcaceae bacterium]